MGVVSGNKVEGIVTSGGKVPIGSATIDVSTNESLDNLEFENGRIVIGSRSFGVIRNSSNTVTFQNPSLFGIVSGQAFTLYDDDDFNDDDPNLNGDEGDNINEPNLPYLSLLSSNDIACPDEIFASNCNVFAPAYIRPVYDLAGSRDEVPFIVNLTDTALEDIREQYFNNKVTARTDFWTIYLLGAYQYNDFYDGDPDSITNPFYNSAYGFSDFRANASKF
jgi:hypothetical protein